jgi:hypothetical protein
MNIANPGETSIQINPSCLQPVVFSIGPEAMNDDITSWKENRNPTLQCDVEPEDLKNNHPAA